MSSLPSAANVTCSADGTILAPVRLRPWLVALLVFVASCGSSAARVPSGSSAGPCGPRSARTVATNGQVRLYARGQVVYGCSVARGRSFRLGSVTRSIRESRVGPVAVAGDLAAYGLTNFGVDTVRASIVVRRLTDGKVVSEFPATRAIGAESFQRIGSVAVRASGAVAWIGSETSIVVGRRAVTEVHSADADGDRVLDSGPTIVATSLRLRGSTLSWTDGGARRQGILR